MKITVDTNVLISATFWNGDSQRIIELVENKELVLVLSQDILKEYKEVIQYDDIQKKIERNSLVLRYTFLKIIQISTLVEPSKSIFLVKDDPDDNAILECALEGEVDYIISQDKHLLKIKELQGIQIITPKEFLVIFSQRD